MYVCTYIYKKEKDKLEEFVGRESKRYMHIIYLASRSLSQAAIFSLEIFSSDILLAGINSALQLRATYMRIMTYLLCL